MKPIVSSPLFFKTVIRTFLLTLLAASANAQNSPSETQALSGSVTIIADYDHAGDGARSSALSIIQQMTSARRCVFVEVPPNLNSPMANFMFRRADYASTVGSAIARYQSHIGFPFQNVVPSFFLSGVAQAGAKAYGVDFNEGSAMETRMRNLWQKLAPYLDHMDQAPRPVIQEFAKTLAARSQIMATNIARYVRSSSCQESVFVVGEGHLRSNVIGIPVTSVRSALASRGIATR